MANKKYTDFPAGTFDPTKLILQADPITGALEKINLQQYQNATQMRYGAASFSHNIPGTDTFFFSYTIPENTLVNSGDVYEIRINFNSSAPNSTMAFHAEAFSFDFPWTGIITTVTGTILMRFIRINATDGIYFFQVWYDGTLKEKFSGLSHGFNWDVAYPSWLRVLATSGAQFASFNRNDILYPAA